MIRAHPAILCCAGVAVVLVRPPGTTLGSRSRAGDYAFTQAELPPTLQFTPRRTEHALSLAELDPGVVTGDGLRSRCVVVRVGALSS